jgi:hypothetical protein
MQKTLILGSALANLSTQAGRIRQLHFSLRVLSQAATTAAPAPAKSSEEQTPAEKEIERKWAPHSVRTGVIARKRGMTAMWDDFGTKYPVTVLQVNYLPLFTRLPCIFRVAFAFVHILTYFLG